MDGWWLLIELSTSRAGSSPSDTDGKALTASRREQADGASAVTEAVSKGGTRVPKYLESQTAANHMPLH